MPNFRNFAQFTQFGRAAAIRLSHERDAMKLIAEGKLKIDLVGGSVGMPKICPLESVVRYIETSYNSNK